MIVRGLIFDFDGVILDTESALIEAARQIHADHGVVFDQAAMSRVAGHIGFGDPWGRFPAAVSQVDLWHRHGTLSRELFGQLPVMPGVLSWLDAAGAAGLALGVASNSTHSYVRAHLDRLGLLPRFGVLSGRDQVDLPKPAPDIYLRTAGLLGIPPSTAVAVEDSTVGCASARAAGLKVIAVPGPATSSHDFSAAQLLLPSLDRMSLSDALARLNGV